MERYKKIFKESYKHSIKDVETLSNLFIDNEKKQRKDINKMDGRWLKREILEFLYDHRKDEDYLNDIAKFLNLKIY